MKLAFCILALLVNLQTMAQSDFRTSKDPENGSVVLKGNVMYRDLEREPTFGWMKTNAEKYSPDANSIKYLSEHLPNYKIVVFLGTWCEDSQYLIPKLHKLLGLTNYPMGSYMMFGVDRAKTSLNEEQMLYKIVNVPTIILYKDNREAGRIVETVQATLEADLIKIIAADLAKK